MRRHESSNSMGSGHSRSHIADARVTPTRRPTLHAYLNTAQISGHTTALHSIASSVQTRSWLQLGSSRASRTPRKLLAKAALHPTARHHSFNTPGPLRTSSDLSQPHGMAMDEGTISFLPPSPRSRHLVWYQDSLHLVWCHSPSRGGGGGGAERLDHDLATWAAAPHPGAL